MILMTVFASSLLLGASVKAKVKFLMFGELNNNSILGFIIAPVVLVNKFCAPDACPAIKVPNAVFVSGLARADLTKSLAVPAASPRLFSIPDKAIFATANCNGLILSSFHVTCCKQPVVHSIQLSFFEPPCCRP